MADECMLAFSAKSVTVAARPDGPSLEPSLYRAETPRSRERSEAGKISPLTLVRSCSSARLAARAVRLASDALDRSLCEAPEGMSRLASLTSADVPRSRPRSSMVATSPALAGADLSARS